MVQKIVTVYTDDLTGTESEEVQTYIFSLDGVNYEIDLTPENYDKLFEALEPFIEKGRKTGKNREDGRLRKPSPEEPSTDGLRAWARENQYHVNDRGRLPAGIREAYQRAH